MKCRVCSCGETESRLVVRLRATGWFNRKKVTVRKGKTYRKLSVIGLAEGDYVVSVRSTKTKDRVLKRFKYKAAGVKEYWMIDPETRQILVCIFSPDAEDELHLYGFRDKIPVGISGGECVVDFAPIDDVLQSVFPAPPQAESLTQT